jgi:predicted Zn-dependent protease
MKTQITFKLRFWILSALTLPVLLTGCTTNPVTGRKEFRLVPESYEINLGSTNYARYQQAQGGEYVTHPEVTAYVQRVGDKLIQHADRQQLPYEFVVLNNDVPNAWALPGGKIAVNRGLLTELRSEAELAAVLGHEIVHAAARHGAKSMERGIIIQAGVIGLGLAVQDSDYRDIIVGAAGLTGGLINLKYGRHAELESDKYGIKYMVAAGYDPHAAVELQETFVRLSEGKSSNWLTGLFSSHPPSPERVEKNKITASDYPPGGYRGEEEYQRMIAPLKKGKKAYEKAGQGYQALNAGNSAQALAFARQALALEPNESHFHGLAAKALAQQGNHRAAMSELDQALQKNPKYYEFYLQKGMIEGARGNTLAAKYNFTRSAQLLPTASAHHALGMMALQEGATQQGINHLRIAAGSESDAGNQSRAMLARMGLLPQQ